jgi:hypothetical protein
MDRKTFTFSLLMVLLISLVLSCTESNNPVAQESCEAAAPRALQVCIGAVNAAAGTCYFDGDPPAVKMMRISRRRSTPLRKRSTGPAWMTRSCPSP